MNNFKINPIKKVTISKDQIKMYNPANTMNKENRAASLLNAPTSQIPDAEVQKINFHGNGGDIRLGGPTTSSGHQVDRYESSD